MSPLKNDVVQVNSSLKNNISILSASELDRLLNSAIIVDEEDTLIAGMIRILTVNNSTLVQETSTKYEIIVRKFPSLESAQKFVHERLEVYSKMWDGCGCKIDYYR